MKNKIVLIGAISLAATGMVHAAEIANYDFAGGSAASTASAIDHVTVSDFSVSGGGGFSGNSDTAFMFSQHTTDTLAGAISNDDYYSFTVTVEENYQLNLDSLLFNHIAYAETNSIQSDLAVFIGTPFGDGDEIASSTVTDTDTETALTSSLEDVDVSTIVLTGVTEIRIYNWDNSDVESSAENGWFFTRLDDVVLNGEVSAIPEPSSYALLAGCFGLAWVMLRRRR
jgi:hypothetical protein